MLPFIYNLSFITFTADCELLYIYRDDFEKFLKPTLQKQWKQIELAMTRSDYFNCWSAGQKKECSILSKVKQFRANDVIYGESKCLTGYAHFILNGSCSVLQLLTIKVSKFRVKFNTNFLEI